VPDEIPQVTEPMQGPKPQQPQNTQRQQHKSPQKQQKALHGDDDANATREAIRRSIGDIQASIDVQDDRITRLAIDVHQALEAEGKRHQEVLSAIRASDERSAKALETVQQMHRALMARLNEREKPRTWTSGYVAIAVFSAAMLLCLALVWR